MPAADPAPQPETRPATRPATERELYARLDALGLDWTTAEHPPLHTVAESKALRGTLPGGHVRNLFLRDKDRRLWLVVAEEDRPVDLKTFRKRIGARGSLSFGSPALLMEVLGVVPGAVTPFGLINDTDCRVTAILDEGLLEHRLVNLHPLRNDATTTVASAGLLAFIRSCGHDPQIMDLTAPPD